MLSVNAPGIDPTAQPVAGARSVSTGALGCSLIDAHMSASVPSNHADGRTHGLLVGSSVSRDPLCEHRGHAGGATNSDSTPEWRATYDRIHIALELTSRLNALRFSDIDSRTAVLSELVAEPLPETAIVHPPFYCTYGLGIELGERSFVGQGCTFLDLGGITVGDRAMISPRVTLVTEGHPVEPGERYDYITVAPIVIEANVWIGAAATVLPGVRIGHDSVVGAGTVVAKDVPPLTVVTGTGYVERKNLEPVPTSST